MPRAALSLTARIALGAAVLVGFGSPAGGINVHLDSSRVPASCGACHEGHGRPGSPMLAGSQTEVCLTCHDSRARTDRLVVEGVLAPGAQPQLMATTLALPYIHPLTHGAFSRHESGELSRKRTRGR